MLVQQFFQVRLDIYIKEVWIPVFGVKHYWYRFEFAKSRGRIHFHMFAINEDKQPHRLLHAMKNGGAQEKRTPSLHGRGGRYRSRRCARTGSQMAS